MPNNINKIFTQPLGVALWQERRKKGLRLSSLEKRAEIPQKVLDRIELGRSVPPSYVKKLLLFYKKNIKVELTD